MNRVAVAVAVLFAVVVGRAESDGWNRPVENTRFIYVSPDGNDDAKGNRLAPLKTLAGARSVVRAILSSGHELPTGIVVEFADGTYRLDEPVAFGSKDSGTPDCPVIYRAAHVGKAVFSGAAALTWEKGRNGVLTAFVPGSEALPGFDVGIGGDGYIADGAHPLSVYSEGRRMSLSSWPKGNRWARVDDQLGEELPNGEWRITTGVVKLSEDETGLKPDLAKWVENGEENVWIDGVWGWAYNHNCAHVCQLDAKGGWIKIAEAGTGSGIKRGAYGKMKNLICEVDEPGEWAVDLPARKVYAVPFGGEIPTVALADGIIRVARAEGLVFEGFVMQYARGPIFEISRSRDVIIRACSIRHGSGLGVSIRGGRGCRVEGCDLTDLGSGGVYVDGGLHDALEPAGHVVDNCQIWDYAKTILYYQPGIYLRGVGSRATHNLIHHAPHMAIGFAGNDQYIGYNVIHDVCTWTAYAGAVYGYHVHDCYSQRGTVIEYNLLHMIGRQPLSAQTEGLYVDGFSTGVTLRKNIVSRCETGMFLQGGHDLVAERNLLVNCQTWCLLNTQGKNDYGWSINSWAQPGRRSEMLRPLFEKCDLYKSDKWQRAYPTILRPKEVAERDPDLAHATLFASVTSNVLASCGPLCINSPKTTKPALDGNVRLDDPGFVDYEGFNWELRDDSPARKVLGGGTRFADMGLYASASRFSSARKFGEGVSHPRKFGYERRRALTRVSVVFDGEMPKEAKSFADDYSRCRQGPFNWGVPARQINSVIGSEFFWNTSWRAHEFSFTPRYSGKMRIILWGEWGAKTGYRSVAMNGRPVTGWEVGDWTPAFTEDNADVRKMEPRGEVEGVVWANGTEPCVAEVSVVKDRRVRLSFESRIDSLR